MGKKQTDFYQASNPKRTRNKTKPKKIRRKMKNCNRNAYESIEQRFHCTISYSLGFDVLLDSVLEHTLMN